VSVCDSNFSPLALRKSRSALWLVMMPLWTTANSRVGPETWGCALAGLGDPCVAQRVCAMPACADSSLPRSSPWASASSAASATRASTLPEALKTAGAARSGAGESASAAEAAARAEAAPPGGVPSAETSPPQLLSLGDSGTTVACAPASLLGPDAALEGGCAGRDAIETSGPSPSTATPAESYPRYSSRRRPVKSRSSTSRRGRETL
jgi:hypothetical protein